VLLFTVARGVGIYQWINAQIVAQSLKTGERHVVVQGSDARYVSTGHLVYALGSTLLAAPFDLRRLQLAGNAVPIVEDVARAATGTTEMDDASTMMCEHDEDEQNLEPDGVYREEVDRNELGHMIGEERSPRLGWRLGMADVYFATEAWEISMPILSSSP
jgi:hypothetical protein